MDEMIKNDEMNMNDIVGSCDIALITLDTLRFDVTVEAMSAGETRNFARYLSKGWGKRHSPASFTYAAHAAFFAGFLPTPSYPGPHSRLFALTFAGSETIDENTAVFDAPDIFSGLSHADYHTLCVGGVGFFNLQNPLSKTLPSLFAERHWETSYGVTNPHSLEAQTQRCATSLASLPKDKLAFTFINVSAMHQPNCHYLPEAKQDTIESHRAALRYVDQQLPALIETLTARRDCFVIFTSDHGTRYGDGGYTGHRLAHEAVWTVPYAHALLRKMS